MSSDADFPAGRRGRDRNGEYVVLAVDGDARLVRYDDGREMRRPVALLRLADGNRETDTSRPPPVAPPSPLPRRKPAGGDRPATFKLEETSPVVASLIHQLAGDPPAFVSHDRLAAALLADPRGRRLVERARELQGDGRSPEAIAANMVAWFSQEITQGTSLFGRDFLRRKVGRKWAYRPRRSYE